MKPATTERLSESAKMTSKNNSCPSDLIDLSEFIMHPCILPSRTLANAKHAKICQEKWLWSKNTERDLEHWSCFCIPPKISNLYCHDFEASKTGGLSCVHSCLREVAMSVRGTDNTALDATGRNAVALELTDRRIDRRKGPCHRPSHHHWQQPQGNPRTIQALRTIPSHCLTKHC